MSNLERIGQRARKRSCGVRSAVEACSFLHIGLGPLLRFRAAIAEVGPATPEEEEIVMTTQELVEQFIEQGRKQGLAQGMAQMARATIELYEARFGPMPPALRSDVEAMHDLPTLHAWLLLAGTGTREEVHDAVAAGTAGGAS
ncbi:hypothetical protein AB3662_14210 [Sorangium cellulosum]|uniref:hypothetical protein n=1 Tax=Sorangium cellulosum TaxID=56 RepID=UPI003D9A3AAE